MSGESQNLARQECTEVLPLRRDLDLPHLAPPLLDAANVLIGLRPPGKHPGREQQHLDRLGEIGICHLLVPHFSP
jgi:hypothetical protein